jgi:hypothetical protein
MGYMYLENWTTFEGWNQDKNLVTLLGSLKIEDFRISYPAIIVTPIAIYR